MVLFTWLGKIFYGLLHRELFLPLNRQQPTDGMIATDELIRHFSLHHLFLQNVRVPITFKGDFPASLFVYETMSPSDRRFAWDLRDNLHSLFISIRMGTVGLIGVLQDGGAQACTAPGSLDTHLCYAAWRSTYSSRASIGV